MVNARTLARACLVTLLTGVVLGLTSGCAALPPNSLLDPTKVGRFALEAAEDDVLRVLTPRETPYDFGYTNTTEPTPADLVPVYDEYRLVPGDVVALTIYDLISSQPFSAALQLNNLGEIRIPELGTVRVEGLTEAEVEQELAARLREAELLPNPVVIVFTQSRRGRVFSILGAVTSPGTYPIPEPDMRLLDMLGLIGDVSATARKMFVIRRGPRAGRPVEAPAPVPEVPDEKLRVPPPVDVDDPGGADRLGVVTLASDETVQTPPQTQPTYEDRPPSRTELEEILSQSQADTQPAAPVAEDEAATQPAAPSFEPLVFDPVTGELLEPNDVAEPRVEAAPPEAPDADVADTLPPLEEDVFEEPFDWEDVDQFDLEQRVIEIDVRQLKRGDERYNIVVRDRDVINIPIDTGVYYMMGEVNRPGVYGFGGREITIKQAIAAVGGFSPLAWPQRCEVIRREPGTDKQVTIRVNLDAIFAGLEPDFYLRDNDIVNVGTHIVAPFLFVIRNSFRFTYGFGFVYDRNFADKDAYGARTNPETLEQIQRQQRGLPF